jgi:Na+-transporting NADH:ubiquinone oxidoreductase subunit NqrC
MDTQAIHLKKNADHGNPYEVDAISGGTMTSNGVTAMLAKAYEDYKQIPDNPDNPETPEIPEERKEATE